MNAVAKAGALTVTGGTAKIAFGERAMQGTLTVAKGATLIPTSNDAPNYNAGNTDVWSVRVYGTLTFESSRWTVKMGELHLYGGATIDGAGVDSYAIDFYNKIFLHTGDTDEETTATISAPIRWSNGTRQITVEEGMILELSTAGTNGGAQFFTKLGAGTLKFSASQPLPGETVVSAGTLEFAAENALTGTVLVNSGATLKVTAGSAVVSSSSTGTVSESDDGIFKVKVTESEYMNGLTLGDNFTLKDGHTNVTFVYGSQEIVGTGRQLAAQIIRFTGPSGGAWGTASNWSNNAVPGSSDVVYLDTADLTVTVASTDTMPARIKVAANATLTGTLTSLKVLDVDSGVTLTFDGTATVQCFSGAGTIYLKGEETSIKPTSFPSDLLASCTSPSATFTGKVLGEGMIIESDKNSWPTHATVQGLMKDSDRWQCVYSVRGKTLSGVTLNNFGNEKSTIRFQGCSGNLVNGTYTINPTIYLVNGDSNVYGLNLSDGSSSDVIEFRKLAGPGELRVTKTGVKRRLFFNDISSFTGAFNLAESTSTLFLGKGRTGYSNSDTRDNSKVFICDEIPEAVSVANAVGSIVVAEDYVTATDIADVAQKKVLAWSAIPTTGSYALDDALTRWRLAKRADGLYLCKKYGLVITIK